MKTMFAILVAAAAFFLTACPGMNNSPQVPGNQPKGAAPISVFAAAALTDVLPEIGRAYEAETGTRVRFSFGATGDLARQVRDGAPADVFFSSSREWTEKAASWGVFEGNPLRVATNGLACVVGKTSPLKGDGPKALLGAEFKRFSICDENVPAGKYAREALKHYEVLDTLQKRFVGQKDVRVALNAVATDELEAGFVYDTDAIADPRVRILFTFEVGSHTPVEHLAAPVKASASLDRAKTFLEFVSGERGQAIFKKRGFGPGDVQ
ncbi:MAG: molybdate ABC transporter substrate-binding protein [Planctomycetes bacterium]|nr:molybdate ABC transporter substrate-binding protein [Planctomycetota bacterium]